MLLLKISCFFILSIMIHMYSLRVQDDHASEDEEYENLKQGITLFFPAT